MSVNVAVEDGIATITVDRPQALNALNSEVLDGIREAVESVVGKADAILLTGAGEKAFVAGADIAEMVDYGPEEAEAFSRRGQEAFQTLADFPGPTVAAINGFALGGGLELALACDILVAADTAKLGLPETTLACDFIYASEKARFGQPEVTLGLMPGFGGTQRLPRRVGAGKAKQLMFTGGMIDAAEALRIGLVDEVTEPDALIATCHKMLSKALRNGPLAVQAAKRLVDDGLEMDLADAISMEAAAFGEVFGTQDQKEGMRAFLEKRKPAFGGR